MTIGKGLHVPAVLMACESGSVCLRAEEMLWDVSIIVARCVLELMRHACNAA